MPETQQLVTTADGQLGWVDRRVADDHHSRVARQPAEEAQAAAASHEHRLVDRSALQATI